MDLKKWLEVAGAITTIVLKVTPAAPLAPFIGPAIQIAELIPGAKGFEKANVAKEIVKLAVTAANLKTGKTLVDPEALDSVITSGINTAVAAVNLRN